MPERVDRCVQSLMDDPNFKPRPGKTKRESAWALCQWLESEGKLKATSDGVKITMEKAEMTFTGPFKVVLPITAARRALVEKAEGREEIQLWLHVEASGPERDLDGDRFSEAGLVRMVEYAKKDTLPMLDGHYRDLLSARLGEVHNPYLTSEKRFAFDVLLNENPFSIQLFNDILAGKRHGASIAGIVHNAEIEEYGENGEFGRIFHDVELLEISRTSWPSFRASFITLLANKVGKLPQQEFEEIVQRRKECHELMIQSNRESVVAEFDERLQSDAPSSKGKIVSEKEVLIMDMPVKNEDGSTEVWGESEDNELVLKIVAPHGWDKKFGVSNKPWSAVKDRSKPCQFCIIKKNEDGSFSKSKSGYPHHLPGCGTIVRGGISAAAGRLAQALKSEVEGLEIPPVVSMATEAIGVEEFEAYEEKAAFSTAELKFAARHIVKHYRRDLKAEPPESLVGMAKTYEDEQQEIIDLIKSLVRAIEATKTSSDEDNMEVMMEKDKDTPAAVEETPVVAPVVEIGTKEEPVVEQEVETVTETVTETEPVQEVEQSEVAGETQEVQKVEGNLAENVDERMMRRRFGVLTYTMQEMVESAVRRGKGDEAFSVIDDFSREGKDVISKLIDAKTPVMAGSFLDPFEEAIEMATGQLSKSRVDRIDAAVESFIKQGLELREVLKTIDTIDDSVAVVATEKAEQAEEAVSELARQTDKLMEESSKRSEELRKIAEALTVEPVREEVGPAEETSEEPIEISDENSYEFTKAKWLDGMKRGK